MAKKRPTIYTEQMGLEICDTISETSKSLKNLCKENSHWPSKKTINQWRIRNKDFGFAYARAKDAQADTLFEEIVEIADDKTHDDIAGESGLRCNNEWVQRTRVKVDARKWVVAKLAQRYSDKIQTEIITPLKTIQEIISAYKNLKPEDKLIFLDEISKDLPQEIKE